MNSANAWPNSSRRIPTFSMPPVSVSRVMIAQIFRSVGQSASASARTVGRSFSIDSVYVGMSARWISSFGPGDALAGQPIGPVDAKDPADAPIGDDHRAAEPEGAAEPVEVEGEDEVGRRATDS